jgi:hypothetical protein
MRKYVDSDGNVVYASQGYLKSLQDVGQFRMGKYYSLRQRTWAIKLNYWLHKFYIQVHYLIKYLGNF